MASQQDFLGLVDSGRKARRPPLVGMQFLHERPVRPRAMSSRLAPWRRPRISYASSSVMDPRRPASFPTIAPRVALALSCLTPAGKPAVEIRF